MQKAWPETYSGFWECVKQTGRRFEQAWPTQLESHGLDHLGGLWVDLSL